MTKVAAGSVPSSASKSSWLGFDDAERKALRYCTYCPRLCRFACPVAYGESRETVTPWGLMRLLNLVDQCHLMADSALLEVLNHCVSCGRCQSFCKHENPVAEVLAKGRASLVVAGIQAPESFTGRCVAPVPLPARPVEGRACPVFLPSCAHAASNEAQRRLSKALTALERLRLPLSMEGRDPFVDCGFHLWEVGRPDEGALAWRAFVAAGQNEERLRVTDCAPGLWALGQPDDMRDGPTTVHLLEWLAGSLDYLPAGIFSGGPPSRVVVHDSCFVSRRLGLGQELRAVVAHLTRATPGELYESGDHARCCGAEGGWSEVFETAQGRAAESVVADLLDSGADWVVTGSTACRDSLRSQLASVDASSGLQVFDLLDLCIKTAEQMG